MTQWMQLIRCRFQAGRIALAAAAALALATAGASATSLGGAGAHSTQRGSTRLAGSPGVDVANPWTHTLYVPIQCSNPSNCGPSTAGRIMEIIDTSRCTTQTLSGCRVVGRAQTGRFPLDAVVDERTDTIYAINGSGSVSVVDGGRCNATVRTHCGVLATIKTGGFTVAGALDPRTHTLYVAALCVTGQPGPHCTSGAVFVIDVAKCNAVTTQGCRERVRKVRDKVGPTGIGVDLATNTIYTANSAQDGSGHTVSVINAATCNGSTGSGCGAKLQLISVGANPFWVTVDQATNTVYVPNNNDGTVSVIDGAACNATASAGCHRKPRAVVTGGSAAFTAVDESRHTLFVMNQADDTISAIDTRTCNGRVHSGCPQRARNERVPFAPPHGYNPNAFALVPGTGTAYMVNVGGEGFLAAYSVKRCNASTTTGCRVEVPSVRSQAVFPVIDPTTDTIYAGNANHPGILVLNGATCNARKLSGCAPVATIPFPHPQANLGSIDQSTHTLYAADTFSDTVFAINIEHCNAHDTSGCKAPAPKMTIGIGPGQPVLDRATHTLYVPEGVKTSTGYNFNEIAVLNAATCSAVTASGCGQPPATISVGQNTFVVALDPRSDTVYAPVLGSNFLNNRVYVIKGATCNASDHSGCGTAVVAKARVGLGPSSVVVDQATHSLYVSNNANGDSPGTVSVINDATCNATNTASCASAKPTVTVGRSPLGMAIDPGADRIYVGDFSAAAVSVIDGSHCNAAVSTGCAKPAPEHPVGSQPGFVLVDPTNRSVFTTVNWGGVRRLSIFATSP